MKASGARSSRTPVGIAALLSTLFVGVAFAEPVADRLEISTNPALPIAATEGTQRVWSVDGGSTLALIVTAFYNDGSTADVTNSSETSYSSLAPELVSTTSTGTLSFTWVSTTERLESIEEIGTDSFQMPERPGSSP